MLYVTAEDAENAGKLLALTAGVVIVAVVVIGTQQYWVLLVFA
jgi:hypothetical protein